MKRFPIANRYIVQIDKHNKPVVYDRETSKIVCGFACFSVAYQQAKRMNGR